MSATGAGGRVSDYPLLGVLVCDVDSDDGRVHSILIHLPPRRADLRRFHLHDPDLPHSSTHRTERVSADAGFGLRFFVGSFTSLKSRRIL